MNRSEKGFTITELLVAIALAGMASVLMIAAFIYSYGSILARQAEADMLRESQLLLRNISDDLREGNAVRASNTIADSYEPSGWVTSDPANILIVTVPAIDDSNDLIYDTDSGFPYFHEAVYFKDDTDETMYRRLLRNTDATDAVEPETCPVSETGCIPDTALATHVENMLFTFYDINDAVTTDPASARSVEVTINQNQAVFGREITTTNATRITLRNE